VGLFVFIRYKNELRTLTGTPLRSVACHVFCSSFLFLIGSSRPFAALPVVPLCQSCKIPSLPCLARLLVAAGFGLSWFLQGFTSFMKIIDPETEIIFNKIYR
jgi:hypothetical protein